MEYSGKHSIDLGHETKNVLFMVGLRRVLFKKNIDS